MTQTVECSVMLLDAVVQTIEELIHLVGEDSDITDQQAVLEEVKELLIAPPGEQDAGKKENADTTV